MYKPSAEHFLHQLFVLAETDPERVLFTFVDEEGRDAETRRARQLVERITRLAAWLREGCGLNPGDTALLIYPPSMEFIEAYAACQLAGIVAAPVYPPNLARPQADLERLTAIAASSGAKAMLTNRAYRWAARLANTKESFAGRSARWPELPWYVTQGLGWFAAKGNPIHDAASDDLALLQFTSGSTSVPKGVRLTHKNLIHQLDLNAQLLHIEEHSRLMMWVPQYHDLGLISGISAVLRGRGSLWFMSPLSFLKRPGLWFDVMSRMQATHTAAPNFGYELASRKTTPEMRKNWNLRSLQIFMNAAEPIVPATMERFFDDFAATGLRRSAFCPAYGLAEHAVGVTIGGKLRVRIDRQTLASNSIAHLDAEGDLELVGCGQAVGGVKVRIVDPATGIAQPEHVCGEIWVQSDSVADGYQGLPELSAEVFKATLAGEEGYWLRTGDMGFLHGGELFIAGRKKDLVIIRGRNLYPEDIEESVRHAHPGIRAGGVVAFSVPGPATEELVILLEVLDENSAELDPIVQAVKRRVGEVWQVQATVGLVAARSLLKTTSGKIRRQACRDAWINGSLQALRVHAPQIKTDYLQTGQTDLKQYLLDLALEERVNWLMEVMRQLAQSKLSSDVAAIGPDDFLPDAGLDSLSSSELLMLLDEKFQHSFSNTLFIEHPTLRGAAIRILNDLGIEHAEQEVEFEEEQAMPFRPAPRAMAPASSRIAIIGGGVGGLISALELARCGYRQIVVFEAAAECGGKVLTSFSDQGFAELGQNFFGDSFRSMLELAMELNCPLGTMELDFEHWSAEYGFEEPPVRRTGRAWYQSLAKATRQEVNCRQPFPSMMPETDLPLKDFLQKHKLRSPHPIYLFDWNAMGYGMDDQISAAYVAAYLNVVGASGAPTYLVDGNQNMWHKLAAHLQQTWGVEIRYQQAVTRIAGDAEGVSIESNGREERFDEVISALPPNLLQKILSADDPLHAWLGKFEYYGYSVHSFRAEGLKPSGVNFMPHFSQVVGRSMLIQACRTRPGWYIGMQYASDHSPDPQVPELAAMQDEMRAIVQQMGGEIKEFGAAKMWSHYFPHLRENVVSNLRQIEALQGQRHLWTTGSWLAFETTEHTARHARHLIRTCFDPAFTANLQEENEG